MPALQDAVEAAYQVFAGYQAGPRLAVCHCPCCMSDETEAALLAADRRAVSRELLCEFTNSAHGAGNPDQVRYFLPRYLELLAQGEETSVLGLETSLGRLREVAWEAWPEAEVQVIRDFAAAYYREMTRQDLEDVLLMLAAIRIDIAALVAGTVARGDKVELARVAALSGNYNGKKFGNAFWAGYADDMAALVKTLQSNATLEALMAAVADPAHPELNEGLDAAFNQFAY
jgi:hypothetical protein